MVHLKLKINKKIYDLFKFRFEEEFQYHNPKEVIFNQEQEAIWKKKCMNSGYKHGEFYISWLNDSGSRVYLISTIDGIYELEYFGPLNEFKWVMPMLEKCQVIVGNEKWYSQSLLLN